MGDWPKIDPFKLIQILKGAYGLTEAPGLWYLQAKKLLEEIGFVELQPARATFVYGTKGALKALLTLHVDDGLLLGDLKDRAYIALKAQLNKKFQIKHWTDFSYDPDQDYLVAISESRRSSMCRNAFGSIYR